MTDAERKRIKEEEAYRREVQQNLEKEEKRRRANRSRNGCMSVLAFIVLVVIFVNTIGSSSDNATSSTSANDLKPSYDGPTFDVTFTSDPSSASLFVDGDYEGTTPETVAVPANRNLGYRLVAEEPYEDYDLYKSYNGTLNASKDENISVWITRTTAEEQAEQRESAEAARRERQRELKARRLYYQTETNCGRGVNITMSNANGDTSQYSNQGNGWYYYFIPSPGQFLYLSAQNQCDYGYVTVKFVKDGVTLKENTSQGGYVIATISGRW